MFKLEEILQLEAKIKQASWVKMFKREEIPQPEAKIKQASWVKMFKREEMLQPEAKRKQAGWVKMFKREEKLQLQSYNSDMKYRMASLSSKVWQDKNASIFRIELHVRCDMFEP